jgi:hypothetical protein
MIAMRGVDIKQSGYKKFRPNKGLGSTLSLLFNDGILKLKKLFIKLVNNFFKLSKRL